MKPSLLRAGVSGLAAVALLCAGCASTPPAAKFATSAGPHTTIRSADTANVAVSASSGVSMADFEKARVGERIRMKLAEKQALNAALADPAQYQVEVTITRYDKGSAFARAMLAGLGQIHIDGTISLYAQPAHAALEEFTVQKTFAWGGIYGASTTMEDIEQTFAEGIANALTGQTEGKQGATTTNAAAAR
ncbi:MAG TPA: DUF4410 domain-containing protein [Rudaea sp.]|nr:DUF4410 domain-containing protein [Rudaea sp.]